MRKNLFDDPLNMASLVIGRNGDQELQIGLRFCSVRFGPKSTG
jgi:hypothetical protein